MSVFQTKEIKVTLWVLSVLLFVLLCYLFFSGNLDCFILDRLGFYKGVCMGTCKSYNKTYFGYELTASGHSKYVVCMCLQNQMLFHYVVEEVG